MKTLLIFSSILFLVGVVVGLPAEARIREQVDTEHEEGIDRVKLRLRDMKAVETGNKEKQYGAQETEIEKRRGGGGRGRSRGGDPGDDDADVDRDADRGYEGSSRGSKGSRGRSKSRPPADEDPEDVEAVPAKGRARDRDAEREPERDRERERGSSRGRGRSRSRGGGGGGVSSERAKDTKISEIEKEDVNRFATQDDIDFTKDSFRTKDKKSHKKEEVYTSRKRR